jgi:hypothetical protein
MKPLRIAGIAGRFGLVALLVLPGCGRSPSSSSTVTSSISTPSSPSPSDMNPLEVYAQAVSGSSAVANQVRGTIEHPKVDCYISRGGDKAITALYAIAMKNDIMPLTDAVLDINLLFSYAREGTERFACVSTDIGNVALGESIRIEAPIFADTKIGERWEMEKRRAMEIADLVSFLNNPEQCIYIRSRGGIIFVNPTLVTRICLGYNENQVMTGNDFRRLGDSRDDFRAQGYQLP